MQLDLEKNLFGFERNVRREALQSLSQMLKENQVALVPEQPSVNLHAHTFFSFNAYNYSPSTFAWEAKKQGLYAIGIMDHEVLHGVEEFLEACDLVGMRGLGGLETRVFIPEWRDIEINMPEEPGVFGFLAGGFLSNHAPAGSASQALLDSMASSSKRRHATLTRQLNDYLRELTLDYERDVLSLTPSGMASERHILTVLDDKSRKHFPDKERRARFWAEAMTTPYKDVFALIDKPSDLQMMIRAKLMKKGSPCFVPAGADAFPTIDESVRMIKDLGAIPVAGWLDGMSEGEKDAGALLDFMAAKGIPAVSIIPDRNWNIRDPEIRRVKTGKLHEIVAEARKRQMLCVVGTDMSKQGQYFVDDFTADVMRPLAPEFLRAANILIGHTRARRYLRVGLLSEETATRWSGNRNAEYEFFERIGRLPTASASTEQAVLKRQVQDAWERS